MIPNKNRTSKFFFHSKKFIKHYGANTLLQPFNFFHYKNFIYTLWRQRTRCNRNEIEMKCSKMKWLRKICNRETKDSDIERNSIIFGFRIEWTICEWNPSSHSSVKYPTWACVITGSVKYATWECGIFGYGGLDYVELL